jgi:replication-associated recombination protein RarA
MKALNKCVKPLEELESMIGMKNVKQMVIDLIFFRLQNLQDNKEELWHLVIQGSPGSGKTEVAKIIGKLYNSLGITKKDKFTVAKRSDLIGKYLGHTAKNTQQIFDDAKGGILFIDEAYSLGNPEGRDSFSKECIDTINQNLTENKDTVVFIAGYKEQLEESFFSYNPGLNRRFKMRLTVDKYNASDLREIYIKKLLENNWNILNNDSLKEIPLTFFEKNYNMFKYNGGDMENLWHLTKIVHARRIFGKSNDIVKKISEEDLKKAFNMYCENDEVKNRNDDMAKYIRDSMYS